jgi:hypothetical protein
MQPFYHTGVRASWQATDSLMLRGLLVNGINNGIDSNLSPSVGAQVGFTPNDKFSLYAGWLGGAFDLINQADTSNVGRSNKPWQHFFDLVLTAQPTEKLKIVVNGDMWMTGSGSGRSLAGGVSAVVGYQALPKLGIAGRFDYLNNADGFFLTGTTLPANGGTANACYGPYYCGVGTTDPWQHLFVGTVTLDYRPFGNHAIFRLEQRLEHADASVFPNGNFGIGDANDPAVQAAWRDQTTKWWTSTTLSLVVQMAD